MKYKVSIEFLAELNYQNLVVEVCFANIFPDISLMNL